MRELVLTKEDNALHAYVLEGRSLVEYYTASSDAQCSLGDIFLGEVIQVVRGLNAVFVNIGLQREGFLHYTDVGPELILQQSYLSALRSGKTPVINDPAQVTSLPKDGNISDYVQVGDWLFVQVVKEMTENKGPRLTTNLGLTGHALVLLPFSADVGVSHRVMNPELRYAWRERLKQLYKPPYGLILRTNGAAAAFEEVSAEYAQLISRWESFLSDIKTKRPPYRLNDDDSLSHLLSEALSHLPQTIYLTNENLYRRVQHYLNTHPMPQLPALRLYRRPEQLKNIFDPDYQKRTLLGRTVTLPNGAYLVIEHTEALHVIDVNTGSLPAKSASVDEVIFQTNLLATQEIARQLRLRDLGGIIIVDFIDMKNPEHRQKVEERLREAMRSDRAKHSILPMSEIGLVQITRQRRRQPIEFLESYPCPVCHGTGKYTHPDELLVRIQKAFSAWSALYPRLPLRLRVHPVWLSQWREVYPFHQNWIWGLFPHRWIYVQAEPAFSISQAELLTHQGELIAALE
ncbi:MAG: Rne/Rng family ribonuclease [Bacteroidia bacterium]|nr:Rne/Rng family ribonuclease [Bacteroidia bacterium]MCX7652461.1 Rne/Rng family ribonuclease [Bacteroidia bacterium]MDW8416863.1 Rne/Rng family ribonuclease [Bacteroidia bacterium]